MSQEHYDNLLEEAKNWLSDGEEIIALSFGSQPSPLDWTVIVLTSTNLHIAIGLGSKIFPHKAVKSIEYSRLWASLNIRTSEPKERFAISISGKYWKNLSKELVAEWAEINLVTK